MNKKGFTLIEIISVIAILGIIGVIVFPIVTGIVQEKTEELDAKQEELIISAAKAYTTEAAFKANNQCISISDLKREGYLENIAADEGSVKIVYNNSKYTYTIHKNQNCTD